MLYKAAPNRDKQAKARYLATAETDYDSVFVLPNLIAFAFEAMISVSHKSSSRSNSYSMLCVALILCTCTLFYAQPFVVATKNTPLDIANKLDTLQPDFFQDHALPFGSEILVVLGCGKPFEKGGELSAEAQQRVDLSVELVKERNGFLLFTGGYGEGILMAASAYSKLGSLSHPQQILVETASRTTLENALNIRDMLTHNPIFQGKNLLVTVVSSDWHVPRALMLFENIMPDFRTQSQGLKPAKAATRKFLEQQVVYLHNDVRSLEGLGYSVRNVDQIEAEILEKEFAH